MSQPAARSQALSPGLGVGVDGALGHPHEVESGAADAPDVADEGQHPQEHLGLAGPHLRGVAEAGREQGAREAVLRRHRQPLGAMPAVRSSGLVQAPAPAPAWCTRRRLGSATAPGHRRPPALGRASPTTTATDTAYAGIS